MKKLLFVLMCLCMVSMAQAAAISLVNAGFEQPAAGKIKTGFDGATDVPGWNSGAMADSGIEAIGAGLGAYEGSYYAYLMGPNPWSAADGPVWQLSGHTIAAGENYRLSFKAGADYIVDWQVPGGTGQLDGSLYYDDAGTRVIMSTVTVTGLTNGYSGGTWLSGSLTISADNYAASIGKNLGVQFQNTYNGWVGVDAVNLELVPEPATLVLLGLGGVLLRRKK